MEAPPLLITTTILCTFIINAPERQPQATYNYYYSLYLHYLLQQACICRPRPLLNTLTQHCKVRTQVSVQLVEIGIAEALAGRHGQRAGGRADGLPVGLE